MVVRTCTQSSLVSKHSTAHVELTCASTLGEQKDFEVYSCHVSPDGSRLATAAGGKGIMDVKNLGTMLSLRL